MSTLEKPRAGAGDDFVEAGYNGTTSDPRTQAAKSFVNFPFVSWFLNIHF